MLHATVDSDGSMPAREPAIDDTFEDTLRTETPQAAASSEANDTPDGAEMTQRVNITIEDSPESGVLLACQSPGLSCLLDLLGMIL